MESLGQGAFPRRSALILAQSQLISNEITNARVLSTAEKGASARARPGDTAAPASLGGVRTEAPWGAGGGQEGRCSVTCCCHGRDMERCGCNRTDTLAQRRSGRTSRRNQRRLLTEIHGHTPTESPSGRDGHSHEASLCPHAEGPGWAPLQPRSLLSAGHGPCAKAKVQETTHHQRHSSERDKVWDWWTWFHSHCSASYMAMPLGPQGKTWEQKRHHLKTGFNGKP